MIMIRIQCFIKMALPSHCQGLALELGDNWPRLLVSDFPMDIDFVLKFRAARTVPRTALQRPVEVVTIK